MHASNSSLLWSTWPILVLLASIVSGWEDDYHYFTSFKDVKEWPKMYKQCESDHNDTNGKPVTLSPIRLPKSSSLKPPNTRRVLWIYNNPPKGKATYAVQYGFPKDKECLQSSFFNPCYISQSFGLVRGVVLSAERERLVEVRRNFKIEQPEKFVTLQTGIEGVSEKKFYEAVFLGTTNCRKSKKDGRSTHSVDGKSYPMEIYMYFVDESLPVMQQTVILVVLVEEQEEDNDEIKSVVKAVHNHLEREERQMLYDLFKNSSYGRERAFHHMEKTVTATTVDKGVKYRDLNSSSELYRQYIDLQERWEKILTYTDETLVEHDKRDATVPWFLKSARTLKLRDILAKNPQEKQNVTRRPKYWLYPAIYRALGYDSSPSLKDSLTVETDKTYNLSILFQRMASPMEPHEEELKVAVRKLMDVINEVKKDDLRPKKGGTCVLKSNEDQTKAKRDIIRKWTENEKKVLAAFMDVAQELNILTNFTFHVNPNPTTQLEKDDVIIRQTLVTDTINKLQELLDYKLHIDEINQKLEGIAKKGGYTDYASAEEKVRAELTSRKELFYGDEADEATIHPFNEWTFKKIGSPEGGNLGMSHSEFKQFQETSPIKTYVQSKFQISWLIPKGGGYYIYKGASPVPPCFIAEHIIVFKKPIKMSREQIKILTTIPTTHKTERDITSTLAPIHSVREGAELHFEKRSHLFVHDDGFHRSGITKNKGKNTGNALLSVCRFQLFMCLISLAFM